MNARALLTDLNGVAAGIFTAGVIALIASFFTAGISAVSAPFALIGLIQMSVAGATFTVLHVLARKETS